MRTAIALTAMLITAGGIIGPTGYFMLPLVLMASVEDFHVIKKLIKEK